MSYLAELQRETIARRARIAARGVADPGINLKRKRPEPEPVVEIVTELPKPKPLPLKPLPPPSKPTRDWVLIGNHNRETDAKRILRVVCDYFSMPAAVLKSKKRTHAVVRPRQICIYLMYTMTALSYPQIGRLMGGFDHSSAIHATRRIAELRTTDPQIDAAVTAIMAELTPQEAEPVVPKDIHLAALECDPWSGE